MKQSLKFFFSTLFAVGVLAQASLAQTQFLIRYQQGQTLQTITDGATITFASEGIGQSVSATVTATYRGLTFATINSFDLSGATDFSVTSNLSLPATLNPSDTAAFQIQFNPSSTGKMTGKLAITFTEGRTSGAINVNLVGVLPDFGLSFIPLPGGNQTSIPAAGAISFPDTTVNVANPTAGKTSSVTFVVTNRGSGAGTVNNIVLAGVDFNLSGVPLLPAQVAAGLDLRFTINFAPTQLTSSTGTVRIDFVNRSSSVNLAGNGVGAVFTYEFVVDSTTSPLAPNGALTLPQTNVGEKSSVTVRVRNTGNADGTITTIRTTGAEFPLGDVPFLPLTIKAGGAITFTINFAPSQPGPVTGRLLIENASFSLSGLAMGVTLTYSATVGNATSTVANNGSVIFPPTQVGATSSARFQIKNIGNTSTFINSISFTGASFSLTGVSALPVRLGGGETISFSVGFAPTTLGPSTGTLRIDSQTFNLSGVGSDPAPLPAVSFPGATATAEPAQQLAVGVSLGSPYPVPLVGKLLLSFNSDAFSDDPAIQFSAGGKSINFVIPANATRALFGLDAKEARFQTGTVAGTLTLVATFATDPGGINLTQTVAPATNIVVAPSAPRIRSVQISSKTTTGTTPGFTVLVTGFATSRSVTQMAFQFGAAQATDSTAPKLDTTSLTLNVDGPFASWYQSTTSQQFGSLFTATITFNVRGDVEAIQSVSVTATNARGASASGSANLK